MLFNSIQFLIFLPIVVFLYFLIPHKYRWTLLLIGSYYFYMSWKPEFVILIIVSTLADYIIGLKLDITESLKKRKVLLALSLIINLGLLFTFKYFNFFSDSLVLFLQNISIPIQPLTLKILLPVGISFYTFQTLSYTIDVYRKKISPEKHLGIFAVYVSYFPQLVAGPIERAKNLLPQFKTQQVFKYKRVTNGLKLIIWGFFKKIVIADTIAIGVNTVYNNVSDYAGLTLIVATILFAFQIYCDFSGYSDIAIGTSQIFGLTLMDNFKRPYFSKSISDFWKRWHISLSSWFKDYLYIPLGGNRVKKSRANLNLLIVFTVSGLWHGANWTFILWGLIHGIYLVISKLLINIRSKFKIVFRLNKLRKTTRIIQAIFVFILVTFAWIFFRANSLSDAVYILRNIFSDFSFSGSSLGMSAYSLYIVLGAIIFMEIIHFIQEHVGMRQFLSTKPTLIRWGAYSFILLSILLFGSFDSQEFIYFQF